MKLAPKNVAIIKMSIARRVPKPAPNAQQLAGLQRNIFIHKDKNPGCLLNYPVFFVAFMPRLATSSSRLFNFLTIKLPFYLGNKIHLLHCCHCCKILLIGLFFFKEKIFLSCIQCLQFNKIFPDFLNKVIEETERNEFKFIG